jgi:sugar/nucleoside kinase (ribokinase family)
VKLVVIGHLARDIFHLGGHDGEDSEKTVESYGGVFYSVATLANLLSPNDKTYPVFGIAEQEYDSFLERLQRYENVETKGIFKLKGEPNQVHYFKGPSGTRIECSRDIAPPIPFSRIKPFLDVDGVLINMASGFDITLETLDEIRMQVREEKIPIHFDFHMLTQGIDQNRNRFPRPLTDWRRWCFMISSVQMSEEEAAGLSAERYDEPTLVNQLMPLMVNALAITRGERGATLVRQEHKKLFRHEIPAPTTLTAVDATGCGDVYGAAFISEYLKTHDFLKSASSASQAAAIKSTFLGADELDTLRARIEAQPLPASS